MTVRLDGWAVAGEIAARAPKGPDDTLFVDDSANDAARGVLRWPGGEAAIALGATMILGRPHPGAPAHFVPLTGASGKVNKQHLWIAVGTTTARIGRFANANPVHVNDAAVGLGADVEVELPAEVSLSRGDLVLTLSRS
jgi:hypothetical protein